ncbi:hypothetical protein ACFQX4_15550 [Roseomonas sp. GCM10028921]
MKHLVAELNGRLAHVTLSAMEYQELITLVEQLGALLRVAGVHVSITLLGD